MDERDGSESEPYPTNSSAADWAQALTKGALGAVPIAGGVLAEVTGMVWAPRLQKRRDEWVQDLAERVQLLSEQHQHLRERLGEDEVMTVAIKAARSAATTHEQEKRRALRNVVLNSALRVEPHVQVQLILTELVDRITEAHIQMLGFMADPGGWYDRNNVERPNLSLGSPSNLFETAFPQWGREFYRLIADDLERLGLLNGNLTTMMTAEGAWGNHATGMGGRLLRFISDPQ